MVNYLYIDDESLDVTVLIAKGLSTKKELKVTAIQHKEWNENLKQIEKDIDGLLLDWDLSKKNVDGVKADFSQEAFAQQLRRDVVVKNANSIPIIICSAKQNFRKYYNKELSAHDLFDYVLEKDNFVQDVTTDYLVDLVKGYQLLKLEKPETILGVADFEGIDERFLEILKDKVKALPIHEVAQYLYKSLVKPEGILIDNYVLGARLGFSYEDYKDSKDWKSLNTKLKNVKYTGAFSTVYPNWWSVKLEAWWLDKFKNHLGALTANEKIELLNKKLKTKFKVADLAKHSKSKYYWTVCEKSKVPIAIEDGVLLKSSERRFEWVGDNYVCYEEALRNQRQISIYEKERISKLKKRFVKSTQK